MYRCLNEDCKKVYPRDPGTAKSNTVERAPYEKELEEAAERAATEAAERERVVSERAERARKIAQEAQRGRRVFARESDKDKQMSADQIEQKEKNERKNSLGVCYSPGKLFGVRAPSNASYREKPRLRTKKFLRSHTQVEDAKSFVWNQKPKIELCATRGYVTA